ncbi:nucleoside hydrolase [Psychrobacillus sp. FSL H8-0510]|uniref:nucleoside hydrolase n=1 Tax=Psychrobacillus sp. FSL H8-0510 TaxID=2921394 RepID=UPI0030FC0AA4
MTDLFHAPQDPDDTIDLAAIFSLHINDEIDIKHIILDDGDRQVISDGQKVINQMQHITGSHISTSIGLADALTNINDDGINQPEQYQEGVRAILNNLAESDEKVDIVCVGSLRDVAAAYNRNPQLMHEKAGRIFVFAGEASNPDFTEYNVELDRHAFVRVMQSGLDIYWLPCFDGGLWHNDYGRATYWRIEDQRILYENLSDNMKKFITFSLTANITDEIAYIEAPLDVPALESLYGKERNLFCAAIFMYLNNYLRDGDNLYSFKEIGIEVLEDGDITYNDSSPLKVKQFYIKDMSRYNSEMTNRTISLLQRKQ